MAGRPPLTRPDTAQAWGEASWEDRAEELAFADDEDRLPWLDSGDDVTSRATRDPARIAAFTLLGAAALAVVGGGVWWLLERSGEPPADGSVIAAPAEPYKVRPTDPGGKQHAGTGDTSFAVGEGQRREAVLAEQAPVPAALPEASPSPTGSLADDPRARVAAAPAPPEEPEAATVQGVGVQVGAYYNTEAAERGWATLIRQTEALQGVKYRIVRGAADIGTVYRLQAVAPDLDGAQRLCAALRADGLSCQVKR